MRLKTIKWLFVLFIATPIIIYFLNLDIEALIHREIHGKRGKVYYLGVDNMFWFQFFINVIYAFLSAYASVLLLTEEEKDKE